MVCLEEPRRTRLLPCHHAILCATCAAELIGRGDACCPHCRVGLRGFEEGEFDETYAPGGALLVQQQLRGLLSTPR